MTKPSREVCLVTGANAGIGLEVARSLARTGRSVVLACRNAQRGEAALRDIVASTGNSAVDLMLVDLSSQASIHAFAAAFGERHPQLHILVNNAGVWLQRKEETVDGFERTWATNVLGYHLLTRLLLHRLKVEGGRIINVASEFAGDLDPTDVEFKRRSYSGVTAYKQSKQAERMLTWALGRRLQGSSVTANAMHPGGVRTQLFKKAGGLLGGVASVFSTLAGKSPEEGADTAVWLAVSDDVAGLSGRFFVDRVERACRFRNEKDEEALWALSESMTAVKRSSTL